MRALVIITAMSLSACATGGLQSYVTPLSADAGTKAANDIAEFVNQHSRPGDGSINIQTPPGDTLVGPALVADLESAGYRINDKHAVHKVRYAVSMLPDGTLLRATIDTTAAARLYRMTGTTIEASGPFTVTEQGQ